MKIGQHRLRLEKRPAVTGWQAARISILAIVVALALFGLIFVLAGINPLLAYQEIFGYAFANPFGLPLTINRFTFLLLCTFAFIIPFRGGLWNIGMTGQFYAGALAAFAVLFAASGTGSYSSSLPPGLVILLMFFASAVGGALIGAIAGYLKGKLEINEIVVTMMLNFIMFWLVSFMIKEGGPFMNPGGRGESFELPRAAYAPLIADIPFTVLVALGLAVLLYLLFAWTSIGYQIKAYGLSPPAAKYAGIGALKIPLPLPCKSLLLCKRPLNACLARQLAPCPSSMERPSPAGSTIRRDVS